MSMEICSKSGKIFAKISDNNDETDFVIVNGKRMPLSDVYKSKELMDALNEEIKTTSTKDITDDACNK